MEDINQALLDFIAACPTCFHAAARISQILREQGYEMLDEAEDWRLRPGGRYAVVRGGRSLIAFRVPLEPWHGFLLTASHSDSPTFQIKPCPELKGPENYVRLSTEPYGGMRLASWLDRPLSAAGRVLVRTARGVEQRLVDLDRDLLVIPSVAVHMQRDANKGAACDPARDMVPLLGLESGPSFSALTAQAAGVEERDLLGHDLYLYVRDRGTVLGAAGELLSAPRLDDLQCVFACLEGFLAAREQGNLPVLAVFDSEEVGSATPQGADGTFLRETLERLCMALGRSCPALLAGSMLLSADNAHAVHPNHPEYADPTHRPRLNGGVVIKHNANQRYTTDGLTSALLEEICRRAEVPVQHYTNRSDLPGGSTLGNISGTHVSLPAADVGLAQLAMHAAWETAGAMDTAYLLRAAEAFYSSGLCRLEDGRWKLN